MELNPQQWDKIRGIFSDAFRSSFHYAVATVNEDGSPHVTPIGSLFLGDDQRGFYFEEYVSALSRNLRHNKRVCVLAVNSGKYPLFKFLFRGKMTAPPGVRRCPLRPRLFNHPGERARRHPAQPPLP